MGNNVNKEVMVISQRQRRLVFSPALSQERRAKLTRVSGHYKVWHRGLPCSYSPAQKHWVLRVWGLVSVHGGGPCWQ